MAPFPRSLYVVFFFFFFFTAAAAAAAAPLSSSPAQAQAATGFSLPRRQKAKLGPVRFRNSPSGEENPGLARLFRLAGDGRQRLRRRRVLPERRVGLPQLPRIGRVAAPPRIGFQKGHPGGGCKGGGGGFGGGK